MNVDEFIASVEGSESPSSDLDAVLQALWWDRKGDWEKAHDLCQSAGSRDGDWVHAYLHRAEGDLPNASYWYSRAGRSRFDGELADEWASIVGTLLAERG